MTDWQIAENWLNCTRAAHRCSPSGFAWHEFSQWLERAAPSATKKPPTPLILAASSEPAASKFHRLRDQLGPLTHVCRRKSGRESTAPKPAGHRLK